MSRTLADTTRSARRLPGTSMLVHVRSSMPASAASRAFTSVGRQLASRDVRMELERKLARLLTLQRQGSRQLLLVSDPAVAEAHLLRYGSSG